MENQEIEDLIALLDPARDYGDRTYKEVVDSVRDGRLSIFRVNLPLF